jgi:predicted dehydrogenase
LKREEGLFMVLRVGFIGVGGVAKVHLKNMNDHKEVELVAVCDIDDRAVEMVASQYGAAAYTNYDTMLSSEKLDALFICVPPFAHGDIEEKAVQKGIHLFVEKPVGLDINTVVKKNNVIQQSGIITSTGYCLRYLDIAQKAKEFLQDKTIAMARGHYMTKLVPTPWWIHQGKSGGQFIEQTTHIVDLLKYFVGDINKVYADMSLHVMKDIPGIDIPDVGSVNMVFSSGAIGNVTNTFTQSDHHMGIEIYGRDYSLVMDDQSLTIKEGGDQVVTYSKGDFRQDQDHAFIQAILRDDRSLILSPYENAMDTLFVTLGANQSAETGLPVEIDSMINKRGVKHGIY